jgi:dihydroxy-acid dehydratase
VKDGEWDRPFVAVCNSYVDIVPGHVHLQAFGKLVKDAIRAAAASRSSSTPSVSTTASSWATRACTTRCRRARSSPTPVETMVRAHCFDAVICIPNCDKIVPGMLMGAGARQRVPTVFVSGGPMEAGTDSQGKRIDLIRCSRVSVNDLPVRSTTHGCSTSSATRVPPTCGSCSGCSPPTR